MSSFNKVILLGRLTRDPELRVMPNGNNICKFSIAVSRKFKAADGSLKEETTFAVATLGCKVNQADSEAISEQMSAAGFAQRGKPGEGRVGDARVPSDRIARPRVSGAGGADEGQDADHRAVSAAAEREHGRRRRGEDDSLNDRQRQLT